MGALLYLGYGWEAGPNDDWGLMLSTLSEHLPGERTQRQLGPADDPTFLMLSTTFQTLLGCSLGVDWDNNPLFMVMSMCPLFDHWFLSTFF
jgi:hypothetical protein